MTKPFLKWVKQTKIIHMHTIWRRVIKLKENNDQLLKLGWLFTYALRISRNGDKHCTLSGDSHFRWIGSSYALFIKSSTTPWFLKYRRKAFLIRVNPRFVLPENCLGNYLIQSNNFGWVLKCRLIRMILPTVFSKIWGCIYTNTM